MYSAADTIEVKATPEQTWRVLKVGAFVPAANLSLSYATPNY